MLRQKSIKKTLLILAIGLALPLSAAAAPAARAQAGYAALSELAASASLIDEWREYALASLTPDFDWAVDSEPARAPSLFERGRSRLLPPPSHFKGGAIDSSPLHVAFTSTTVSDTPLYVAAGGETLLPNHAPGLQRYLVAPSISQRLGAVGSVSFSAIFAYQHFADIGSTPAVSAFEESVPGAPLALRTSGTSSGAGLRIDYTGRVTEHVNWQAGVQSRINMDALNNYRGLYAEPGTFDIPASANVGLDWLLGPSLRLDAGVERVMYSQIEPFTSSALPKSFLALLGSSASPEFIWQNLNVYTFGASWRDAVAGDWSLRYSTREQPLPTAPLLQHALPTPSARNYELSYARAFGERSKLRFSASYAPTDFVLGVPLSYSVTRGGNQTQWEALWITTF